MLTTTLVRLVAGGHLSPGRAAAVTERNVTVLRTSRSYWWLVASAFAEPLLYFVAIGWGVGALVHTMPLPDGSIVPYLTFIAPAMLASSAMNGAIAESTTNFFSKMKYAGLYNSVLNTPVSPAEIAFGELWWATVRGGIYSGIFLLIMVATGVTTPLLAAAALPAALLIGFSFGAVGLTLATFMRGWQHFDYVTMAQFALFVFSGTYVPVGSYPVAFQLLVQVTPLYHGIELVRDITLDQLGWSVAGHAAYLVALAAVGVVVAGRRTTKLLST